MPTVDVEFKSCIGIALLTLCSLSAFAPCSVLSATLDVDKSGIVDASDGVLLLRKLNGASTIDTGVVLPSGQTNSTVMNNINAISTKFDVDKSGTVDATDGVLILRRLNGASTLNTGVVLPSSQTNATILETIDAIRFDVGETTTSIPFASTVPSTLPTSTVPAITTTIKPITTTSSSTTSSVLSTTTSIPVNTPPIAFFTVTPPSGDTATTFNINASGSSDKEDAFGSLQFRWDWNNDGVWEKNYSSEASWNLTFPAATTANIKLEVKDSGGLTATYTKQISISSHVATTTSSVATTTSVKPATTSTTPATSTIAASTTIPDTKDYAPDTKSSQIFKFIGLDDALNKTFNNAGYIKLNSTDALIKLDMSTSFGIMALIFKDSSSGLYCLFGEKSGYSSGNEFSSNDVTRALALVKNSTPIFCKTFTYN
ncbi:MAG: hypothetical protein H7839_00960 [Magnetococcus sp. YQC-5]